MLARRIFKQTTYTSTGTRLFQRYRLIAAVLAVVVISIIYLRRQHIINHFRTRPIDLHGLPSYPKHFPRARRINTQELIRQHRNVPQANTIPHIIHQSWESEDIPTKWATWSDSWRVKHPNWEWVLWTNEDNRALVEARAPWFLETYDALPGEIRRADVMRNFYMFFFGG
jgi:mannosyltransferase OCH1-like enzyme